MMGLPLQTKGHQLLHEVFIQPKWEYHSTKFWPLATFPSLLLVTGSLGLPSVSRSTISVEIYTANVQLLQTDSSLLTGVVTMATYILLTGARTHWRIDVDQWNTSPKVASLLNIHTAVFEIDQIIPYSAICQCMHCHSLSVSVCQVVIYYS